MMFVKKCVPFIFTLYLVFVSCNTSDEGVVTWADFMVKAKWGTQDLSSYLEPFLSETVSYNNVSEQCAKSLFRYINGLKEWDPWAIQMLDATGKIPSGYLSGTKIDFGSYDQCLEIRVNQNETLESFNGQFCMLTMKTPLISPLKGKAPNNKSYIETYGVPPDWIYGMMKEQDDILSSYGLSLGICIPSICSKQEIYNIITHVTLSTSLRISLSDCQVSEPRKWPVSVVVSLCILASLLAICVLGTTLDILDRREDEDSLSKSNESLNLKCLKAFSLYTNANKLFQAQNNQSPLDFLHGLRLLLCLWILLSHLFMFPSLWQQQIYANFNRFIKLFSPVTIIVENGMLCLGNFFHLSGFLMTYILWEKLEKSDGKISVIKVIFQRYCRFTPTHLFMILVSFVIPVLHNGPIWNSTWENEIGRCQKFGWRNIFYIQNLFHVTEICWVHTYYLGACLQVQVVSLLVLSLTLKSPKKGVVVGLFLLIGCFMNDYIISIKNDFPMPSTKQITSLELGHLLCSKIYFKPFHHMGAHLVGMVLGWYILKFKNHKLHLKYRVIGWILYIAGSLFMLFAIRLPITDLRITAFYHASKNTIWAILFSWLVYCCFYGAKGKINRFLSWKALVPFSQISFSVYLIHPFILIFKQASLRTRQEMTYINVFTQLPAFLLMSFICGFFVYIAVEVPFNTLFDLLFKKSSSVASVKEHSTKNGKEAVVQKNEKVLEKEA